jgi:dolichol-phosphate mannosyltransferase
LVDDGSIDTTVAQIAQLAQADSRIKLIALEKNYGKHTAVCKAIAYCKGQKIVYMDPDLQDPPIEILNLIKKIEEGYHVVYGIRKSKKDNFENTLFSNIFWLLIRIFGKYKFPKRMAVMRMFTQSYAKKFNAISHKGLFLEGMFLSIQSKSTCLPIDQNNRYAGVSKFTFKKKFAILGRALCDATYFFQFMYVLLIALAIALLVNFHTNYSAYYLAILLCSLLPLGYWHYQLLKFLQKYNYSQVQIKQTINI